MSRIIVKLRDFYFTYSSIADAPIEYGKNLDAFKADYRFQYGEEGMRQLEARLARVEKYGSSSIDRESAEDVLSGNRAGPDEDELTIEEIYKAFCLREPIRNGWLPE